jgi:predicted nucleic acid-binding protein
LFKGREAQRRGLQKAFGEEISLNILFDTNVILDALLDRNPFGQNAVILLDAVEQSAINGFLCADSVTTIFYLMGKIKTKAFARQKIKLLLDLFEIAPVNRAVLDEALGLDFTDFEDAVVHQSAIGVNADGIVTRNTVDFKKSKIAIYSPIELISILDH